MSNVKCQMIIMLSGMIILLSSIIKILHGMIIILAVLVSAGSP